ncbi:MAG: regulatory protein GemA [Pseudomonadota bacterium]|nr:regulatory protein GemA [Pseudomonadota bacterium]
MNRARLIALIHAGARALGMDEATRRDWIEKHTGKRSCKDCSEADLSRLGDDLRANGFQPGPATKAPGGNGPGRPTKAQWGLIAKLAKQKGMTGLDDAGLATLAKKVCKVDSLRFLDQHGARALILALERWIAWGKAHPEKAGKAAK